jgi:hypothetical protein
MRKSTATAVLAAMFFAGIALAGCSSGSGSSTPATTAATAAAGYVVNTGGATPATPGISVIDRNLQKAVKTVRFTIYSGLHAGHFANVTPDGTEIWDCIGQGSTVGSISQGAPANGIMNVYNSAAFLTYSTLNNSNKTSFIKQSFPVGCGVQSTLTPSAKYLFASVDQKPNGINVFDVVNHKYLGNITNGNTAPHVGDVSADGTKYYTTTSGSHKAVGYDISGLPNTIPTTPTLLNLDFGYGSLHALRLHPNGRYLFVGNNTWPVPATATVSTSGTNVVDLTTQKIIATIPGRPHNYAISPDGKYLLSTELAAPNCSVVPDAGNLLQFIDISSLSSATATPDPTKIVVVYQYTSTGFGGSHASWDPLNPNTLYYSVIDDVTSQGWLLTLNTANLSAATPSVSLVSRTAVGTAPHGVFLQGYNGN